MSIYKEIFVKGYYRNNGQFVSPHIRKVKISNKYPKTKVVRSYRTVDENQLCFNFSANTVNK